MQKLEQTPLLQETVPENAVMIGIPAKNINTESEPDSSFKPYGIDRRKN